MANWNLITSFDKIKFVKVESSSDDELFKMADLLLKGSPIVANFDKVDVKTANHMLSFLSGVVYALNGQAIQIRDKLFMLASEEDFKDGTLNKYIEDIQ